MRGFPVLQHCCLPKDISCFVTVPLQGHFLKLEVCWQPAELIFLVSQHDMIMHDELVQRRLAWRPHRLAAISAALTWKQSILLPIGVPSWTLVGEACMRSDRAEALACQFCTMLKNSLCGGLVITLLFQAQPCDFLSPECRAAFSAGHPIQIIWIRRHA